MEDSGPGTPQNCKNFAKHWLISHGTFPPLWHSKFFIAKMIKKKQKKKMDLIISLLQP